MEWYMSLQKSALTPDPIAFKIVWPILYVLMAIAIIVYWRQTPKENRPLGVTFFGLQLLLNFLWSPTFFGMQNIAAALGIVVLLIIATGCTIVIFSKTSRTAAWLMVPYFLWLLFAGFLNFEIWRLN